MGLCGKFYRLLPSKCFKLPIHLTVDDKNYHDYYDIANLFNERFANISSSVQLNHFSDLPDWDCSADYVDRKLPSGISHYIPPISESFVRTSLQQPSTCKTTGLYELGGYLLNTAASSIS